MSQEQECFYLQEGFIMPQLNVDERPLGSVEHMVLLKLMACYPSKDSGYFTFFLIQSVLILLNLT